jgi:hypothetical protein
MESNTPNTHNTESITLKEVSDILAGIPNHTWPRDMVLKDLYDIGINPVYFYYRRDDETIEVDKRKLMLFRIKYSV